MKQRMNSMMTTTKNKRMMTTTTKKKKKQKRQTPTMMLMMVMMMRKLSKEMSRICPKHVEGTGLFQRVRILTPGKRLSTRGEKKGGNKTT